MGCWAVPTVAAEVWGIPLQVVLNAIKDGTLLSKTEAGMTLVDVDPNGIGAARRRSDQRPPTFSIVTREELTALHATDAPAPQPVPPGLEGPRLPLQIAPYFHRIRRHALRARRSPCGKTPMSKSR